MTGKGIKKGKEEAAAASEKATDDVELLMNVIIACIGGNSRPLWLFVHSVLRWPARWRDGHSGKGRLPTHRRRTLACESWLPCALKFDLAKLPILRETGFRRSAFWGRGQSCGDMYTEYCLDIGNTQRRVLSLSLPGWDWTVDSGVESRPLRSRNSNSSLFLAGRTDSSQACFLRTDRAQICLDRQSVLLPACRPRSPLD